MSWVNKIGLVHKFVFKKLVAWITATSRGVVLLLSIQIGGISTSVCDICISQSLSTAVSATETN